MNFKSDSMDFKFNISAIDVGVAKNRTRFQDLIIPEQTWSLFSWKCQLMTSKQQSITFTIESQSTRTPSAGEPAPGKNVSLQQALHLYSESFGLLNNQKPDFYQYITNVFR